MEFYSRPVITVFGLVVLFILAVAAAVLFGLNSDAGAPPCVPATQEAAAASFVLGIYVIDVIALVGSALCYWLALQLQWFFGESSLVRGLACWAITATVSLGAVVVLYVLASPCMQAAPWQGAGIGLPMLSLNILIPDFWIGRAVDLLLCCTIGIEMCHFGRRLWLDNNASMYSKGAAAA